MLVSWEMGMAGCIPDISSNFALIFIVLTVKEYTKYEKLRRLTLSLFPLIRV